MGFVGFRVVATFHRGGFGKQSLGLSTKLVGLVRMVLIFVPFGSLHELTCFVPHLIRGRSVFGRTCCGQHEQRRHCHDRHRSRVHLEAPSWFGRD